MTLFGVPKPIGFELRAARADKSGLAKDWTPEDALYDAARRIAEEGAEGGLIVVWYAKRGDDLTQLRYSISHSDRRFCTALLQDALFELQCQVRGIK